MGPFGDVDDSPTKRLILEGRGEPSLSRFFSLAFGMRPAEEIYDLSRDPAQLENVAGKPGYEARLSELRGRLERFMAETGDPRVRAEEDRWDRYPFGGPAAKAGSL